MKLKSLVLQKSAQSLQRCKMREKKKKAAEVNTIENFPPVLSERADAFWRYLDEMRGEGVV